MAAELGGNPVIVGNPDYGGGSLRLMGHIFMCDSVTSESRPPTPDDIDIGTPDFCSGDIFFKYEFREKLDADEFYDTLEFLHKTRTLATDDAVTTSGYED